MSSLSCRQGHQNSEGSKFCSVCGDALIGRMPGPFNLSAVLPPGKRLRDRYVIRNTLGEGGFGRTYLIEDTGRFDERLVLKEFLPSVQGPSALQKSVELFQREAVTLYRLKHEQIPKFWEIFQAESRLFLVEDFIAGSTYEALLNERIRNREVFSETEILHLFRDLLPVLTYLHREGIIHRDISPDNIIHSSRLDLPVLIDLGAAKQTVLNATTTTVRPTSAPRPTMIGKMGYSPDEQIRLGMVAPYSDLYALAVTAIVLMTGKQPNQLLDQYTLMWNWEEHVTINPTLAQAINRMLAPRPDHRFQSAEAALSALALLLAPSSAVTPTPETAPPKAAPQRTAPKPSQNTVISPTPVGRSAPNDFMSSATPANISNTSGSGKLFSRKIDVPADIKRWSWGAFFLGPIWGITNQVWISLLLTPVYLFLWLFSSAIPASMAVYGISSEEGSSIVVGGIVVSVFALLLAVPLGLKGNVWAWKSKRWPGTEQFKSHQKNWAIAGWITLIVAPLLGGWMLSATGF